MKKTVNRLPYILNIGDTHHVVVDNEIFMTFHCVSEALLNLFATYYVFYIEYSREVKLSLLFIQSKIFELKDSETSKIQTLKLFARNLEIVKDQMDAKKKKILTPFYRCNGLSYWEEKFFLKYRTFNVYLIDCQCTFSSINGCVYLTTKNFCINSKYVVLTPNFSYCFCPQLFGG